MLDIKQKTRDMVNQANKELGLRIQETLVNESLKQTGKAAYIGDPVFDGDYFDYVDKDRTPKSLSITCVFELCELQRIDVETTIPEFLTDVVTVESVDNDLCFLYQNIELAKHLNYECSHGNIGFIEEGLLDYK